MSLNWIFSSGSNLISPFNSLKEKHPRLLLKTSGAKLLLNIKHSNKTTFFKRIPLYVFYLKDWVACLFLTFYSYYCYYRNIILNSYV